MNSRKQVFIHGNFRGALDIWRKEESMSWNDFGEFLSKRADETFSREGVVRKFLRIEGDYKVRKNITVSEVVIERLTQSRKLAGLGWNDFFLWLLERRHFEILQASETESVSLGDSPLRETPIMEAPVPEAAISTRLSDMALDRRERSPRVPGCLKNRYGAVVFYLGPEAFRLMEKWRRHGRWDDLDERLEALILGPSVVSLSSDSVQDVEETSLAIPPSSFRSAPMDPEIARRSAKVAPTPSASEFAFLRSQWLIEAKRWEKKPSDTRAWPDGARVRVIEREETCFENMKMRRVEAVFIYEMKESDDLNILKPYRLDFSIEAAMEPGSPSRIEPGAFKFRSLSFRTEEEMMLEWGNRVAIFDSLEKEGR